MNNIFVRLFFLLCFVAAFAGVSYFAVTKVMQGGVIETDIMALLPESRENEVLKYADQKLIDGLERRLVILVGSKDATEAVAVAKKMVEQLGASDLFETVDSVVDAGDVQALHEFYKAHRAVLLTEEQKGWLQQDDLKPIHNHVLAKLYGVGGDIIPADFRKDPLFLLNDYVVETLGQNFGNFELIDDMPVAKRDGKFYAVIRVKLAQSPFSIAYQGQAISALDDIQKNVLADGDGSVSFLRSSLLFHAAYGTDVAKGEISRMGAMSFFGVFMLFLIVFKTLRPFIVVLSSVLCGAVAGVAACLYAYGEVHMLTLVFGTSLIGISVDYALHFFAEKYRYEEWDAVDAVKSIFPGITMGLITSVVGFVCLCMTPINVLHQMAVFSIGGLVFVYLCVIFVYPFIFKKLKVKPNSLVLKIIGGYIAICKAIPHVMVYAMLVTATIILMVIVPGLPAKDDIRSMQNPSPELLKNDIEVARITGTPISGQMMVVVGETEQDMLNRLYETTKQISGYTALSQYILPQAEQEKNKALLLDFVVKNESILKSMFAASGYPDDAYKSYLKTVEEVQPFAMQDYLDIANNQELGNLFSRDFYGKVLGFVFLKGDVDLDAMTQLATGDENVFFVDKVGSLSASLERSRYFASLLAIGAYVLITLILMVRYGFARGIAIVLPCLFAALATLYLVVDLNGSYSLFHILALFLVMGVGVDYGLFLAEGADGAHMRSMHCVMIAVTLSAMTTLLSFGLLAGSATSALHDFGLTVIIGIVIIYVFTPCLLMTRDNTKAII